MNDMEKRSKFEAAVDWIWSAGEVQIPKLSEYESIFNNFNSEKLNEKFDSEKLIESFGKEIYTLINESLAFCSEWKALSDKNNSMQLVPIDNFGLIRLRNWMRELYVLGCKRTGWSYHTLSSAKDSKGWRDYVTLVAEGFNSTENQKYKPSQLIGICVLFMIDHACDDIRLFGFTKETTNAVLTAYRFFHAADISNNEFEFESALKYASSESARKKAILRHANDPKQIEKKFVFDCWTEWQKNPTNYAGQAAFARDMLEKCTELTSQKKIEDWCREWKKAVK